MKIPKLYRIRQFGNGKFIAEKWCGVYWGGLSVDGGTYLWYGDSCKKDYCLVDTYTEAIDLIDARKYKLAHEKRNKSIVYKSLFFRWERL